MLDTKKLSKNSRKRPNQWIMTSCTVKESSTYRTVYRQRKKERLKQTKRYKQLTEMNDFNNEQYRPAKSKAYLRVVETGEYTKNAKHERLEKARKAIETRKQYSEIVKDIFFKDALLNNKSSQQSLPRDITSLRDIKEEADKKRKKEYDHHRLMQELGKKYLEEIRVQNMHVTPQKREAMDKKRFSRMKSVPQMGKSRKYLDQIARDFKDPMDLVMQKDLTRNLNPTMNSDSHNAFIHNMKYFDNRLDHDETKLRYKAGGSEIGLELGDKYINSIQTKLNVLEKEVKADKKNAKKPEAEGKPQENAVAKPDAIVKPGTAADMSSKPKPDDPKAKPADPKAKPDDPKAKPTDPKAKPEDPKTKPADPKAKPDDPKAKPDDPKTKPADPKAKPDDSKPKPAPKP